MLTEWKECGLPFSKVVYVGRDKALSATMQDPRGYAGWDNAEKTAWMHATAANQKILDARKTFCTEGLNRVGVQFELQNGQRYLIGDVCLQGNDAGHDEIFYDFDIDSIVVRYREINLND